MTMTSLRRRWMRKICWCRRTRSTRTTRIHPNSTVECDNWNSLMLSFDRTSEAIGFRCRTPPLDHSSKTCTHTNIRQIFCRSSSSSRSSRSSRCIRVECDTLVCRNRECPKPLALSLESTMPWAADCLWHRCHRCRIWTDRANCSRRPSRFSCPLT